MIYNQCQKALKPFRSRRKEIPHIYIDFGGDPKWLRRFSENDRSWFEMLCGSVIPKWDDEPHYLAYKRIPFDYWQNMKDALDSESIKQGLHFALLPKRFVIIRQLEEIDSLTGFSTKKKMKITRIKL